MDWIKIADNAFSETLRMDPVALTANRKLFRMGSRLEPPGVSSRQRGGGTLAGDGQAVGRALDLRQPGGAATAVGGDGRGIQRQEYPSVGGRSRLEAYPGAGPLWARLYAGVGAGAL